jgi:hypothetical protein
MQLILGIKCIYDTARQSWAVELILDGEGRHRFPISPDQVEPFVEAFDDCSAAEFDPASGEVVFTFEYEMDDDDEDEEGDGDDEADDDDLDEEDDGEEPEDDGDGKG